MIEFGVQKVKFQESTNQIISEYCTHWCEEERCKIHPRTCAVRRQLATKEQFSTCYSYKILEKCLECEGAIQVSEGKPPELPKNILTKGLFRKEKRQEELIMVICPECGKPRFVAKITYDTGNYSKKPRICRSCRNSERLGKGKFTEIVECRTCNQPFQRQKSSRIVNCTNCRSNNLLKRKVNINGSENN